MAVVFGLENVKMVCHCPDTGPPSANCGKYKSTWALSGSVPWPNKLQVPRDSNQQPMTTQMMRKALLRPSIVKQPPAVFVGVDYRHLGGRMQELRTRKEVR